MVIAPNTRVILLKSPIEIDDKNQINFANAQAQFNYFYNLPKIEFENFTYQRKDNLLKVEANFDDILNFNYVMYQNEAYSDKWFYAFIENMEYVSDRVTAISIKTDVWQTWCFDLNFKKSFVEREHVNDDTFGKHTLPEGIEYGDYICNAFSSFAISTSLADSYVVAQVSDLVNGAEALYENYATNLVGGLPNGCYLIILEANKTTAITNFVRTYDHFSKADAIVSMFIVPKRFFPNDLIFYSVDSGDGYGFEMATFKGLESARDLGDYYWSRNTTIDGYKPKNNKLFCQPYNYLLITNNGGSDLTYAWEDFSSANATFKMRGITNQGCDIKATPTNFKRTGLEGGYEWNISSQKLPTISWNSNFYLNWQAVNGANIEVQTALSAGSFGGNLIGNMLSGNFGGVLNSVFGLAGDVANTMQQIKEAKMIPDSAKGNLNTGDINYSLGKIGFTGYKMSIKAEYARKIDEYLSAFGYKINEFKNVQWWSRKNWNYVKTIGVVIEADIPQNDLNEIKNIFNTGVTFWHNPSTFLDYSQDNSII